MPVDRSKLVDVVQAMDDGSLTQIVMRIPLALRYDAPYLPVIKRAAGLLEFVEGSVGPGLDALAAVVVESFPHLSDAIGPFDPKPSVRRRTLPAVIEYFTGRAAQLARLHTALNTGGRAAVTQVQAISGLGGVGKTALAIEYAYHFAGEYDHLLFCSAESVTALFGGYRAIAEQLGLSEAASETFDAIVAAVKQWLNANRKWLLILDNADFYEGIEGKLTQEALIPFLPEEPKGHILITSRTAQFRGGLHLRRENVLLLDTLEASEALQFLTERVQGTGTILAGDEEAAAKELAEELGYLPLALEQAGAYIAAQSSTFRNYVNLYRKRSVAQLEKAGPETGSYPKTVATTWEISFEEVERVRPAAAELLTLCAFLAPDAIPAEVVAGAAASGKLPELSAYFGDMSDADVAEERYHELLEPLTRYSLVSKDQKSWTFSVHRLVQAVRRDRLSEQERQEWICRAVEVVCSIFPNAEFDNWSMCARLVENGQVLMGWIKRITLRTETAGLLLNRVGYFLFEQGQFDLARLPLEEGAAITRAAYPSGHPNIAASLNNLAGLYRTQRLHDVALLLYEEALSIERSSLPAGHSYIAGSLSNLAGLYKEQGLYDIALPLYEESLLIVRSSLPAGHPHIALSLNNLASLYDAQGLYAAALPLYEESLSIYRSSLPTGHPHIAISLNNLALLYKYLGKPRDAEQLMGEALEIFRHALPEEHPYVRSSTTSLQVIRAAMQQRSEESGM